jgi:nitrite reductase (NADH) small subunit
MSEWVDVCAESDLNAGTGVCALIGKEQVAVFKVRKDNSVFAVSNYDPIGKANVLSRGITGSIGEEIVVASPLYKQHFSLSTGVCIEDENQKIKIFASRINKGVIQVQKI